MAIPIIMNLAKVSRNTAILPTGCRDDFKRSEPRRSYTWSALRRTQREGGRDPTHQSIAVPRWVKCDGVSCPRFACSLMAGSLRNGGVPEGGGHGRTAQNGECGMPL